MQDNDLDCLMTFVATSKRRIFILLQIIVRYLALTMTRYTSGNEEPYTAEERRISIIRLDRGNLIIFFVKNEKKEVCLTSYTT